MCTVSFIPVGGKVLITSNRDEKHWRKTAVPPSVYSMKSGKILAPKDSDAGGVWFAVHENGNAVVFLNGAFRKHDPQPPYRKSRGLVALELIDDPFPLAAFKMASFFGIEPFTAIIYDAGELYECRWDGTEKYTRLMDAGKPHIWSSATLYDDAVVARREAWFREWLSLYPDHNQESVLLFHQFTGDGDRYNDLMMDRGGLVFTVSITSAEIGAGSAKMIYLDFKNQQHSHHHLFTQTLVANS